MSKLKRLEKNFLSSTDLSKEEFLADPLLRIPFGPEDEKAASSASTWIGDP